jgi:hypothetical protein
MRTTGAGAVGGSCCSRDDHHRSVFGDHGCPRLYASAVWPLARQLATRFFQVSAVLVISPRWSRG